MSSIIHLLIFFILPYCSTSSYTYGIIRNATIKFSLAIPDTHRKESEAENCDHCLCDAFQDPNVDIFTCTENQPKNFTCQFYYFMPKLDEIKLQRNDTNIYIIKKENKTIEKRYDCCNTTYLIEKIKEASTHKVKLTDKSSRFLVEGDDNIILTTSDYKLTQFNLSAGVIVNKDSIPGDFLTVGYYNKTYYLGRGSTISVFDENYKPLPLSTINDIGGGITTIRFLKGQQMLVGTEKGVYMYEKDANGIFRTRASEPIVPTEQIHGFGIVRENEFYVGWLVPDRGLRLYIKGDNQTWNESSKDSIPISDAVSDVFYDEDCERIWVVTETTGHILVYNRTGWPLGEINMNDTKLFNLLIRDNYTLVISSDSVNGVNLIDPSLKCLPRH
jgi:hypothetical protein